MENEFFCIENIVGITQNGCDCNEVTPPTDEMKLSDTGFYLDNYVENIIDLSNNCEDKSVYVKLSDELEIAKKMLRGQIASMLQNSFSENIKSFAVTIGKKDYTGSLYSVTQPKFELKTKKIDGFYFNLQKIGLMVNNTIASTTFTVKKVLNREETQVFSTTLTNVSPYSTEMYSLSVNGKIASIPLPCDGSTYVFEYILPNGVSPLNNPCRNTCGSCNGDYKIPQTLLEDGLNCKNMDGILLDFIGTCNYKDLMCVIVSNYENKSIIAEMLCLLTSINLIDKSVSKPNSFRFLKGNSEMRKEKEERYSFLMNLLSNSKIPTFGHCFCKTTKLKARIV